MFIYLVAVIATIFLIFGLVHSTYLNDWLQTSVRCSLALYNGLTIGRPVADGILNDENLEGNLAERPVDLINDRIDFENVTATRITNRNKEELHNANLLEGIKLIQLETPIVESQPSKQEEKDNLFEKLKSSIEKTSPQTSSRLNTRQIYNLLANEVLKENEARQKLLNNDKNNFNETTFDTAYMPSSMENGADSEDTNSNI